MENTAYSKIWVNHYDPEVPAHLDYEKIPLYEYLDRNARRFPKRKAIIFHNWSINYSDLKELAERVAANFQSLGVKPGDRIAIMLPNTPQMIISYWGALKAGATVVMINPLYMEKELLHHFQDSEAKILIALDMLWPKLKDLLPRLSLEKTFFTRINDCLKFPLNFLYKFKAKREKKFPDIPFDGKKIIPWKELETKKNKFEPVPIDPLEDLAVLQYTGGTTGIPKGVMLTHFNLAANVQQCLAVLHKLKEEYHKFLGVLPFFHIYALTATVNLGTALGATILPLPSFVPREVLKIINKHRPTIFPSAPSIFIALLRQKDLDRYDLSSIKYCISGSAPLPMEVMKKFKEITGAEIVEGYGLTEASPVTHLNPLDGVKKSGSIGLPFPDTDARIVDMDVGDIELPPRKIGELIIKGPQVMKGYWKRSDETANVLRNGWLYTGDIAYMDEQGYFFIVDRKKDLIISGGFNIYPREIDEVLYEHPKVQEAVTVGVPSKTRGEIVKAYIVPKAGVKVTKEEIISFCRQKLASYKVPRQIEFRTELPKNYVGKVLRRVLREEEKKRSR